MSTMAISHRIIMSTTRSALVVNLAVIRRQFPVTEMVHFPQNFRSISGKNRFSILEWWLSEYTYIRAENFFQNPVFLNYIHIRACLGFSPQDNSRLYFLCIYIYRYVFVSLMIQNISILYSYCLFWHTIICIYLFGILLLFFTLLFWISP